MGGEEDDGEHPVLPHVGWCCEWCFFLLVMILVGLGFVTL